jgi:hypothetical protein
VSKRNGTALLPGIAPEVATPRKTRALSPTKFLCRKACREFLLEEAKGNRAHKFSRVSMETLRGLNELVRQAMVSMVKRVPSKGQTI